MKQADQPAANSCSGFVQFPGMPGNGTNPEQLFAAGWSACFMGAMRVAAAKMKTRVPVEAAIDAEVDLCDTDGEYFLQARLNVSLPGVEREVAQALVDAAHETCPYSKATRGNIDVAISVVTTVLHVPSIGLVVAGDVVYNGVHQYLAEAANGGLRAWIKGLDIVAALQPRHVVAGHKNKALQDDPKTIDETRRYLEDAERLISSSHTAREFYDAMLERYPNRLNPGALWFWSAKGLFPQG